jgi:hypothetical protein
VDYAEAGGITIGEAKKLSTAYTKVFATGIFTVHVVVGMKKMP